MKINQEERDFLIGLIEEARAIWDINESMEYSEVANSLLKKLNKEEPQ